MAVNSTKDMSICLYEYLCQDIVGSEDYVRLIRLINASNDRLDSQKFISRITSGSFGEGLELEGSDLDIMIVPHLLEVTDQTKKQDYYYPKNYFLSDTDDVKPGFAYLRLMKGNTIKKNLLYRGVDGQLFLSSVLLKQQFLNKGLPVVHGPCVSDETGRFDIAICPHSKSWITTASKWVTRSNKSWPTNEVKLRVINHGVLFVPIGTGGNLNEELKWRISFSVGEKFLIYSFNHTQLLCYALMKILLKDIISKSPGCKDLLCSYFIKTILFWISEEIPILVWTPDNLIPCFMRCFKRLMYCVEQSMCPHYFIPENNLFENKIIEHGRIRLLKTLCMLFDYGWRCIFISPHISIFSMSCRIQFKADFLSTDIAKIIKSKVLIPFQHFGGLDYVRNLQQIFSFETNKLRYISLLNMTINCFRIAQTMQLSSLQGNKYEYKQYKQCMCCLLQCTHQDAVTGWLMLASLFYKKKQYNIALYVLIYSLRKCTPDKLYLGANVSDLHRTLFRFETFKKLGMIRMLRMLLISFPGLIPKSCLIPDELKLYAHNVSGALPVPPVVYLHFLKCLCHYHLDNVRNYQESLGDLHLTIEENYFISERFMKAGAYDCLGIAFLVVGDRDSARAAFGKSKELNPDQTENWSYKRLAMMDKRDN